MANSSRRRLTAEAFDLIVPHMTLSTERITAARECMVDGVPQKDVAEKYGWTVQGVSIIVRRVWETMEKLQAAGLGPAVPSDWQVVRLVAPEVLIAKWRAELDAYRANVDSGPEMTALPTHQ